MKLHYVFYIVGIIFIFISVWYFASKFLLDLPPMIKLSLLIFSFIATFIIGEFLRGGDL